jgi:ribosome biogenesis GTPase A
MSYENLRDTIYVMVIGSEKVGKDALIDAMSALG